MKIKISRRQRKALTTDETGPPPEFIYDTKSNSIIIRATETQYADIKQLLEKMDQRPLQVLIDVIIAEVTLDDSELLGVRWALESQDQITIGGEPIRFLQRQGRS
jgi:general secretion pathway protein D